MENTKSILRIFDNPEFGKVRAVSVNGNPWFVGKDIAEILKYQRTADAISSHVDDEDKGVGAKYQVILSKEGKKIRLALVDLVKEKECKPGKIASYKKSGKYYVITINNMPLKNTVYKDEKTSKINTKTKYNLGQGIGVTGICTKTSGYVYVDDLKISGVTTQNITFNKKDYKWYSGGHLDKNYSLKVTTIK